MFELGQGHETSWLDKPEWYEDAACAGLPDSWFFLPDCEEGKRMNHHREARLPGVRVCQTCPVRLECLESVVMDPRFDVGVWGGTTTIERRRIRRARQGLSVV